MDPTPVAVESGGKTYTGEFTVERGILIVATKRGRTSIRLRAVTPQVLARVLLRELINRGKA